jgi:hypothetical protein
MRIEIDSVSPYSMLGNPHLYYADVPGTVYGGRHVLSSLYVADNLG